jgi:hypothetical protein
VFHADLRREIDWGNLKLGFFDVLLVGPREVVEEGGHLVLPPRDWGNLSVNWGWLGWIWGLNGGGNGCTHWARVREKGGLFAETRLGARCCKIQYARGELFAKIQWVRGVGFAKMQWVGTGGLLSRRPE